jgi:hypothetical protein
MKNRTPLILGGVFILLLIIFFATSYRPREVTKGAEPLFKGKVPDIDKIELTNLRLTPVVLERLNGVWTITKPIQYKASEVTIKNMLENLTKIEVDGVVSSQVDAQEKFEVSDSLGTAFKAYAQGKLVLDAIVGKHSLDLGHTYARLRGSNDIALWRGLFSQEVVRAVDDWRDKSIYSFNPGDILSVKAVEGKMIRALSLVDSTWTYTENGKSKPISQDKVKRFIELIASLNCDAFADEKDIEKVAGENPTVSVSFTVRNGDTHSFVVWRPKEKDNRYLARKQDGDILFRFYSYRGDQLPINYEKLKADDKA